MTLSELAENIEILKKQLPNIDPYSDEKSLSYAESLEVMAWLIKKEGIAETAKIYAEALSIIQKEEAEKKIIKMESRQTHTKDTTKVRYSQKHIMAVCYNLFAILDATNITGASVDFVCLMFMSTKEIDGLIPHCETFEEKIAWFYKALEYIADGKDPFLSFDKETETIRKNEV